MQPDNEEGRPGEGGPRSNQLRSTIDTGDDTATDRLLFGRHARRSCCLRSHQSWPCPRCCSCIDECSHPAYITQGVA